MSGRGKPIRHRMFKNHHIRYEKRLRKPVITRLFRRGGVKRMSKDVTRMIQVLDANYVVRLLQLAKEYMWLQRVKTIRVDHIMMAAKQIGDTIYA